MTESEQALEQNSRLFPQNNTEGIARTEHTTMDDPETAGQSDNQPGPGAAPKARPQTRPQTRPDAWAEDDRADGTDETQDGSGTADEDEAGQEPAADFAPEELNLPEGFSVDQDLLERFAHTAQAKGLGLEDAQGLVDLHVDLLRKQEQAFIRQRLDWREELKADPTYGGARFTGTVRDAQEALKRFDPSGEMLQMLTVTGFGDNPAVIKLLANINTALADDVVLPGSGIRETAEKSLADRLWPDEAGGE